MTKSPSAQLLAALKHRPGRFLKGKTAAARGKEIIRAHVWRHKHTKFKVFITWLISPVWLVTDVNYKQRAVSLTHRVSDRDELITPVQPIFSQSPRVSDQVDQTTDKCGKEEMNINQQLWITTGEGTSEQLVIQVWFSGLCEKIKQLSYIAYLQWSMLKIKRWIHFQYFLISSLRLSYSPQNSKGSLA